MELRRPPFGAFAHTTPTPVYSDSSLALAPGSSLTPLNDGVIEASAPDARERFGFDRTQNIGIRSTYAIDEAAQFRSESPAVQ
ncbi:hypothetical protein [Tunturiibacter gelidiferens]|uniref:TonB-dependent receptor n=1 Tax=Tunturiibacter gelidiferens TaxID=3069689 RepID=A0AAU7Z0C5_9BACT